MPRGTVVGALALGAAVTLYCLSPSASDAAPPDTTKPRHLLKGGSPHAPQTTTTHERPSHVFFLLDRSGSMEGVRDDVVVGFNAFVEEQQRAAAHDGAAALVLTLVQFDSQDPHEVVFARRPIAEVPPLTRATFEPRHATPLLDAVMRIFADADATVAADGASSLAGSDASEALPPRIVVVIYTDGHENCSRDATRATVAAAVAAKRAAGWAVVFLGANVDAFAEAAAIGAARANAQNYAFDGRGVATSFKALSRASSKMRTSAAHRHADGSVDDDWDHEDVFGGVKLAEEDFRLRQHGGNTTDGKEEASSHVPQSKTTTSRAGPSAGKTTTELLRGRARVAA
eukprot:CAMPEP_0185696260 /NCGR_PEP_ID=MMETSP1164-20130828/5017_1 /TAXON_ID=1104430 /ORGANISM="Chrysoreinhardia sp, Strain CCMP2950" /LENGTH=342 /DNA_ID=CAMNT_0028363135 /DNA_START=22 /DNA_END=1050 /DNA_ORIENTATION=+